jgi:glycosyltransferase involved in cell wall biosynthesis
MKIAIDALLLGRPGGVGGYVASLLRALALCDRPSAQTGASANEYVIYTTRGALLPSELTEDRFSVRRPGGLSARWLRVFWQQAILPRQLAEDGVDVLHAPSYVAPLKAEVPVVLTLHDVIALKYPHLCSRANARHYRHVLPLAARKASLIVASSCATRDDIVSILGLPPEKVRVIYPGVDAVFHPVADEGVLAAACRAWHLPRRFILFVGNIEPKKGLDTLMVAFDNLVRREKLPHGLVVVGAPQRGMRRLRALVSRLGLGERVLFTGHMPQGDLPALYSLADLFVFPSLYEGFGLPPLEAMACGTPVVCSNAGSLPEVVADAAVTVPPGDAEALRQAIAHGVADDTLRERLVSKGRERVARFTWASAAAQLLEAYRDAAGIRQK